MSWPVDYNLQDMGGIQSWECWACHESGPGLQVPRGHEHRLYVVARRVLHCLEEVAGRRLVRKAPPERQGRWWMPGQPPPYRAERYVHPAHVEAMQARKREELDEMERLQAEWDAKKAGES